MPDILERLRIYIKERDSTQQPDRIHQPANHHIKEFFLVIEDAANQVRDSIVKMRMSEC